MAESPGSLALAAAGTACLQPPACLPMKRHSTHEIYSYCNKAAVSLVTSVFETAQGPMMDIMAECWFRQSAIFKCEVLLWELGTGLLDDFVKVHSLVGCLSGRLLQVHFSPLSSSLQHSINNKGPWKNGSLILAENTS